MPRSSFQAVFLVDGYNVVGAWADLRQVRDQYGLEEARRCLAESLISYSTFQGFDTQVVFDAQYQDSCRDREVITSNLCLCYTDFGETADTYIEKACADFRFDLRKFHQRLIVATSDRAQQLTVTGYGAEWMSAERLAAEVDAVARRVQRKQKPAKKSSGRFLAHGLDPEAQRKLAQLRFGK
ncbi:NYN domain-containing protein [Leptolyngbya sp. FACHB-36]|uniref:NYN domain-containing protein n=1 Tax=Leptolyngbya sp. FACHB-36 TaxID=2692808 RepID=UPI0016811E11|nr:NYN domain-containing protein [Leptolyngbya sp. FACHB-36]MBD2021190.1 NYN domain-containing protein [Leptolyngbya sp. FACHB-36]